MESLTIWFIGIIFAFLGGFLWPHTEKSKIIETTSVLASGLSFVLVIIADYPVLITVSMVRMGFSAAGIIFGIFIIILCGIFIQVALKERKWLSVLVILFIVGIVLTIPLSLIPI